MRSFSYLLGNQQGHPSPPLHNLLSKTFLSFPAPLFIIWPHCDGWNIDRRGQLRKSLHLSSQRLLGGQACHFPEKHFIYQILIRLECPSPWEVDELWLLLKKKKKIHSDRVLGKLRDLARVVTWGDGGWHPWILRVCRPLLLVQWFAQPLLPSSPRKLHPPKAKPYPLNISLFSLPPAPNSLYPTSWLMHLTTLGASYKWNQYSVCLFGTGFFHWASRVPEIHLCYNMWWDFLPF